MTYRTAIDQPELENLLAAAAPGMVIDLSNRDLSACDFMAPDLRSLLERISTHNRAADVDSQTVVNLTNANISGLNFDKLYLNGFIMTGAIATHTIFTQSDLSDVLLDEADASFADFRYAKLTYTKLYNTNITEANFTGADLTTTYGLCFNMADQPNKVVERLQVVHSVANAQLATSIETLREQLPPHKKAS